MLKLLSITLGLTFLATLNPATVEKPNEENTRTKPYILQITGQATGAQAREISKQTNTALASWYGYEVCADRDNCFTASGSRFNENALTCACSYTFPLGAAFLLTYQGKTIKVVCNDRGAFEKYGRTFDLSRGAFERLAPTGAGVIEVTWEKQ